MIYCHINYSFGEVIKHAVKKAEEKLGSRAAQYLMMVTLSWVKCTVCHLRLLWIQMYLKFTFVSIIFYLSLVYKVTSHCQGY